MQSKQKRNNLSKKITFDSKANQLNQLMRLCHAEIALIIRKNEKYYIYRSIDHEQ